MNKDNVPPCDLCGEPFKNGFEYVDHMLEGEEFDPALILPNGYKLMIGSLLRTLFENSDSPQTIQEICEATYMTLFTAETDPGNLQEAITDLIVESSIADLDEDIKRILEDRE